MANYVLHSTVRKVQTRTKRALAPKRHRFVQRIGGGDITLRRGRPVTVTEEVFLRHFEDIVVREDEGKSEVRTVTGELVDLSTLKAAPPAKSKPQPEKKLDTVADDKPTGRPSPCTRKEGGSMRTLNLQILQPKVFRRVMNRRLPILSPLLLIRALRAEGEEQRERRNEGLQSDRPRDASTSEAASLQRTHQGG